jgi:hypothetical protein
VTVCHCPSSAAATARASGATPDDFHSPVNSLSRRLERELRSQTDGVQLAVPDNRQRIVHWGLITYVRRRYGERQGNAAVAVLAILDAIWKEFGVI